MFEMNFDSFCEEANNIWFLNRDFNALICMNKVDGRIKKIQKVPGCPITARGLYSAIFKIGNDLIGIPGWGDNISIYNLQTEAFDNLSIRDCVKIPNVSNYKAICKHKEEIIMFPKYADNDKILIYNYLEKRISAVKIEHCFFNKIFLERAGLFHVQFEIVDECLFIPFIEIGAIFIFNFITKQKEIRFVNGLNGCTTINYYNKMFYLASRDEKKIYAVDTKLNLIEEYTNFPVEFKEDKIIFIYSHIIDDKILYFPQLGNMIISFDLKDKIIREEMKIETKKAYITRTYMTRAYKDEIIALMQGEPWLAVFFFSKGTLQKRLFCPWDEDYNDRIIEKYLCENKYFENCHEEKGIGLKICMNILKNSKNSGSCKRELDALKKMGRGIYQYIIKE